MPSSLPNPFGPATQVGAGLSSISDAIFNMGRAGMLGRYGRQRSAAQDAEDYAKAQLHGATMKKLEAETQGLTQANQATAPGALDEFAAGLAGLDLNTFQRANELNRGGMPAGPIPEYGEIRPMHQADAALGRAAAIKLQADPKTNLSEISKALFEQRRMQNYNAAMNGQLPVDKFGNVTAASEGKPRYGMEGGIQFSNQTQGDTFTTPLGTANIAAATALGKQRTAAAGEHGARTGKLNLETRNLNEGKFGPETTIEVGGIPQPRFLGQVKPGDKAVAIPKAIDPNKTGDNDPNRRKPIAKAEYDMMNNHLSDLAGTQFDKIDQESRAQILTYAGEMTVDPASEWHRNPLGAVEAAVREMAPQGFEDTTGFFSSANYKPVGGVRPSPIANRPAPYTTGASTAPAPAPAQAGGLPPQAMAQLREGETVTFGNGQTWMLQNGMPVQVR